MVTPTIDTTASADIIAAGTFGPVNPDPTPAQKPQVVSAQTGNLSGFLPSQDRVAISQQARDLANQDIAAQQPGQQNPQSDTEAPSDEYIQVSSSIGRAAQTGNLSREEALAIYQKIASLI